MHKNRLFHRISAVLDGVILMVSSYCAVYCHFRLTYGTGPAFQMIWTRHYLLAALLYTAAALAAFWVNKLYESAYYRKLSQKIIRVILVNTGTTVIAMALLYFFQVPGFSRFAILLFWIFSTVLISLKYAVMRGLSHLYYDDSRNEKHVLVIGMNSEAQKYMQEIMNSSEYSTVIDGYLSPEKNQEISDGVEYCGSYADIGRALQKTNADTAVIALSAEETSYYKEIVLECEKSGVRIEIIPYYNDYMQAHPQIDCVGDIKLINIRTIPLDDLANASIKRFFDILLSLTFIVITLPIMLIAVIGIQLTMPGKVMFCQERIGLNKKPFRMYKFRSMKENSRSDTAWSTADDERRTPFGRWIRKLSIDELPQLFNVLKGDMSIVGPRPEIPFYVNHFGNEVPLYMLRSQVRPGMTGWAQVHGLRGDTSIEKRVKYDMYYIENWSLGLDAEIILKTVFGGFINRETVTDHQ